MKGISLEGNSPANPVSCPMASFSTRPAVTATTAVKRPTSTRKNWLANPSTAPLISLALTAPQNSARNAPPHKSSTPPTSPDAYQPTTSASAPQQSQFTTSPPTLARPVPTPLPTTSPPTPATATQRHICCIYQPRTRQSETAHTQQL